jgi:predicted RNase H-like HicB family nuclease
MAKKHVFQVIVEQDEEGWFVAECPALKACYTQGKTYEEAITNIRDVIVTCLDDLKEKGQEVPRQPEIIGVKRIEIAV